MSLTISIMHLTRREKRELKAKEQQSGHHHLRTRESLRWAIVLVILFLGGGYLAYIFNNWKKSLPPQAYTSGPVHWHARVNVKICGESRELPADKALEAHGKSAVGEPLLHHHHDGIAHIEGTILRPEEITIGRFFDVIGAKFSNTEIFEKTNGDQCSDGKVGKVKTTANSESLTEPRDYVLRDGDLIEVEFESQ